MEMPGKQWTGSEKQTLRQMLEKGYTVKEISEKLKRPVKGVKDQIKRLGLNFLVLGGEEKIFCAPPPSSLEPAELLTHEHVLKILSAAVKRLQEGGDIDKAEVQRLNALSALTSCYDVLLERFERWVEIERRMTQIEEELKEMRERQKSLESPRQV